MSNKANLGRYEDKAKPSMHKSTTGNGGKPTRKSLSIESAKPAGGNIVPSRLNAGGNTKFRGSRGSYAKGY